MRAAFREHGRRSASKPSQWMTDWCTLASLQICLEILHFSNYSGDAENSVMRETWTRLLDQALLAGGVGEACSVLRRVGPLLYPGDGGSLPLHTICLHLETAAHVLDCSTPS